MEGYRKLQVLRVWSWPISVSGEWHVCSKRRPRSIDTTTRRLSSQSGVRIRSLSWTSAQKQNQKTTWKYRVLEYCASDDLGWHWSSTGRSTSHSATFMTTLDYILVSRPSIHAVSCAQLAGARVLHGVVSWPSTTLFQWQWRKSWHRTQKRTDTWR